MPRALLKGPDREGLRDLWAASTELQATGQIVDRADDFLGDRLMVGLKILP